jgi:cell shape-determining protein MreC
MAPVVGARNALGATEASRLRGELAQAQALLVDRDALYKENIELKARLGRNETASPRVLAAVLMRPPGVPYDTLLIDAGTQHGIALGDLVSAGGQAIIGRVIEAYQSTARVELFSAPGQSYQALLRGTTPVAVEGQGGGSMRAQVPAGTQVAVGDEVEFPGMWGGLSALVSAVDARAGESFIVLFMHLPANPAELRFVEVLTEP